MRKTATVVLLFLLSLAAVAFLLRIPSTSRHNNHRSPAGDQLEVISNEDLTERFRRADEALFEDKTIEFRRCVLEIERRRLLSELSPEKIRELLGEPGSTGWVYLDQRVVEANNPLKRWMAKKGTDWTYLHRWNERTVIYELAFDGQTLAWTLFADDVNGLIVEEIFSFYGMTRPNQDEDK